MRIFPFLISFFLVFSISAQEKNVLVFHETQGYRHASIEKGIEAIRQLGEQNNFHIEVSQDSRYFIENDLEKYDLIIFLNTTGDILNMEEQMAFQNYMDAGGNFFGIHAAADTEYEWKWYGDLVGAYFKGHPEIQKAEIKILRPEHFTLEHIQNSTWEREDEWYNYKEIGNGLNVLMTLDESTYKGGENGDFHPIAWYQNYIGGGKSVYTGGGHTAESYSEPFFLEHLERCILFAMSN